MTRIFFIVGLWLSGLLYGQIGGSDRCAGIKSGGTRLPLANDSTLIREGPLNRADSYHYPFAITDYTGK